MKVVLQIRKRSSYLHMKILVVCQHYYPEPFRITDICEELVKMGHDVSILTDVPNYPEGEIYKDYRDGSKRNEIINGVHVYRCYTIPRKHNIFFRLLNYYSFAISSSYNAMFKTSRLKHGKNYDVVFVNQSSPVMMAYAGIAYAWKHNKKLVLYCMDLWPDSLVVGGIGRKSLVYKAFHHISKWIYRRCDKILTTSKMFKPHIAQQFGIKEEKIEYMPQYAESTFDGINSQNKENKDSINLVFAGYIGIAQDCITILRAANHLKDCSNIIFHIVGDGLDLKNLKAYAEANELHNVVFYGRKPLSEMPKYYNMADAMLVTLGPDPIISLTLPGKVQGYMDAGKPILGAVDGETKAVVEEAGCGMICGSGDSQGLAENILKFSRLSEEERQAMGRNSRAHYTNEFAKDKFFSNLEKTLYEHQVL